MNKSIKDKAAAIITNDLTDRIKWWESWIVYNCKDNPANEWLGEVINEYKKIIKKINE